MNGSRIRITQVCPPRFPRVADLAQRIWPVCFGAIISAAQCEYMIRQRYSPEAMAQAIADGMTYEIIHLDDLEAGFGAHGPASSPTEWKLWQVYILPELQGRGLGRDYIDHVARSAYRNGRSSLLLTVNKRNDRARALYERCGFQVRESASFDIGNGFVMDDYVLVKSLHPANDTP